MQPLLSVVVPCTGKCFELAQCLNSTWSSRYETAIERIVVVDRCDSEAAKVATAWRSERFASLIQTSSASPQESAHGQDSAARVQLSSEEALLKIVTLPNEVVSTNVAEVRNCGFDKATGLYVCTVDADDAWADRAAEALCQLIEHANEPLPDVIKAGTMVRTSKIKAAQTNLQPLACAPSELFAPKNGCLDHTVYLFGRAFLVAHGLAYPSNMTLLEDSMFVLRAVELARSAWHLPSLRFYHYRPTRASLSHTIWLDSQSEAKALQNIITFFAELKRYAFGCKSPDESNVRQLYDRYLYVYLRVLTVKGISGAPFEQFLSVASVDGKSIFFGRHWSTPLFARPRWQAFVAKNFRALQRYRQKKRRLIAL